MGFVSHRSTTQKKSAVFDITLLQELAQQAGSAAHRSGDTSVAGKRPSSAAERGIEPPKAPADWELGVMTKARRQAYEGSIKTPQQKAANARDRAFGKGLGAAARPAEGGRHDGERGRGSAKPELPVSRQWVTGRSATFSLQRRPAQEDDRGDDEREQEELVPRDHRGDDGRRARLSSPSYGLASARSSHRRRARLAHDPRLRRRGRPDHARLVEPRAGECAA